jgi:hypothetical protein
MDFDIIIEVRKGKPTLSLKGEGLISPLEVVRLVQAALSAWGNSVMASVRLPLAGAPADPAPREAK